MKFIDEAIITVRSGDGGNGCLSFRREKYVPLGGPDGGDGGKGGDVTLVSSQDRRTLYPFRFKHEFTAQRGGGGEGRQRTGKNGSDIVIEVPPGTIVRDAVTGDIIKDFCLPGESFIIARGGRGGKGNTHFKSSTHRTPRFAQPGEAGEVKQLKLELKLLADVGIIGLPNAGKSTLISVISAARPKIADYPFTTLVPNLGVVKTGNREPFVVADIPGLIAGAHAGAGLGIQFLRHIVRTRLLVHLIDASAIDLENPLEAYAAINTELFSYSADLARKPQIIALNKLDLPGTEERARAFKAALKKRTRLYLISAATVKGVDQLLAQISNRLDELKDERPQAPG
ncbi:MAG: GTPase ObgE [Syntrophobacterales bacterium]|nr:MAG: GTPase ObgE [Syntrophobacterales bacterium]